MTENRFACLIRIKTEGGARRHLILKQQFTIGRSETADLPLLDLKVSRQHAKVEMRGEEIYVTDISSNNGITLGGKKLTPGVGALVEANSSVRFGTSPTEYFFLKVEAPMDMRPPEEQKKILLASMADAEEEIENSRRRIEEEERRKGQEFIQTHDEQFRKRVEQHEEQHQKRVKEHEEQHQKRVKDHEDEYQKRVRQFEESSRKREEEARIKTEKMFEANELKIAQDLESTRRKCEEMVSAAKGEAVSVGASTLVEFEEKRDALKAEVDNLLAESKTRVLKQEEAAVARIEKMEREAQSRQTRDIVAAKQRADEIVADAEDKYKKRLEGVDVEKKNILDKAAAEAKAIEHEAAHKAKVVVDDAKKRSSNIVLDTMKRAEREIEEEKRAAVDAIRAATFAEQEKIVKEYRTRIEKLREEQLEFEAKVNDVETNVEALLQDRLRLRNEVQSLEKYETERRLALSQIDEQITRAEKTLKSAESAETRRDEAKREMTAAQLQTENFKTEYDRQVKAIEDDLQKKKEQTVLEFKDFRRRQEDDIAKEKLASLEKLRATIVEEEARYERTLKLRAGEIADALSRNLLPRLEREIQAKGVEVSLANTLDVIKSSVEEVIVKEPHGAKAITEHLGVDPERVAEKKKKIKRWAIGGAAAAAVIFGLFAGQIFDALKKMQADHSEQTAATLKRNAESIYTPVQNDDWHETYTGNVLYLRYYYEAKADPIYQEQWLARLNNLDFLRSLHLSEDDMVQFLGKERALIKQLGDLKQDLDSKYLDEGLAKMNQAETQVTSEMRQVLKSDENLLAVRKVERDFVIQYIKLKFGGAAARTPTQDKSE